MKAATCFSGIGAPEVGGPQYDWVFHAEIEKFPAALMAIRHPSSVNLSDVLAPDFIDRAKAFGPLDLMAGGPPCQGFSFAGLRGSLDDPRGQLSLQWVNILHAIRPRNAITENVPGWLSTDDNAFGCFLGAVVGADNPLLPCERPKGRRGNDFWRWSDEANELVPRWPSVGMASGPRGRTAWRLFDAQYFGLAQRRERVFAVSDFGDGADPVEVLFERQSLRGNYPPSRGEGERVAGAITASAARRGGTDSDFGRGLIPDIANTLTGDAFSGGAGGRPEGAAGGHFIPEIAGTLPAGGNDTGGDRPPGMSQETAGSMLIAEPVYLGNAEGGAGDLPTLTASNVSKQFNNQQPLIGEAYAIQAGALRENPTSGPDGVGVQADISYTIEARAEVQAVAFKPSHYTRDKDGAPSEIFPPLSADADKGDQEAVVLAPRPEPFTIMERGREGGSNLEWRQDGTANALLTPNGGRGGLGVGAIVDEWAVRRLTPVECEKLQGFPPGYTLIEFGSRRTVDEDEAEYLRFHGATVTLDNEGKYRTNAAADGPRYKSLGNSWAVPCGAWIIDRIHKLQTRG